ncbi:hypothetical protein DdX_11489 [Ditylenchus destructor]|uniref:Uncharacterized protein n=1 Tax=Ditylenchus destructor TaxID=166010 RepID=A0AAD4N248_9BILA|nr:hypothetical protein DdX_11489 [Ditylenchus destructor]
MHRPLEWGGTAPSAGDKLGEPLPLRRPLSAGQRPPGKVCSTGICARSKGMCGSEGSAQKLVYGLSSPQSLEGRVFLLDKTHYV